MPRSKKQMPLRCQAGERRDFLKISGLGALSLLFPGIFSAAKAVTASAGQGRPNILWLVSEDNSPFLGCYGNEFATTPNLDKLAAESIRYTNAFANAPVCAPARSCLLTGMYPSTLGTDNMRSSIPLPRHITFFTEHLRKAGYYCTNNFKTDYNIKDAPKRAWDACSITATWKKHKPGQPFFSFINFHATHESSLHRGGPKTRHDQAKVPLAPYHPDTPEMRHDYARYYDRTEMLDRQIGDVLAKLEKDGLAEDTIVFYFSDHGGILPRSKRWLYDSGMRVPFIVRFPEKYRHLAPGVSGSVSDRLVSFIDFAPTVLNLAGLKAPKHMQGKAFMGKQAGAEPEYVYGSSGRMDIRYVMIRAVRDKNWKYIRNYMPHLPYAQHIPFHWRIPAMKSWQKLYDEGKLEGVQKAFFEAKPTEELYDINADPHEINNLAGKPKYNETLLKMREAHRDFVLETRDTGFISEAEMVIRQLEAGHNVLEARVAETGPKDSTPYEVAQDRSKYDLERLLEAAETAGNRNPLDLPKLVGYLADKDSGVRYWGAIGCVALTASAEGREAAPALDALTKALKDTSPSVQVASAEALCIIGQNASRHKLSALKVLADFLSHRNVWVALHAANSLDYLGEKARPVLPEMKKALKPKPYHYTDNDIFCGTWLDIGANFAMGSPVAAVMKKAVDDLSGP